ncbi:MAG: hypothetical protein HQK72_15915 [Desulfamplus sp.]|nr:hypothetical protein [Desulfamplus sp.]
MISLNIRADKISWFVMIVLILGISTDAVAERIFFAGYKGGFYIKSEEEGGMELRLGGSFQSDYRYYEEDERADNRFDIRRARLIFNGQLTQWFRFGMEYEFQGNETSNLIDAYGEAVYGTSGLRFGQFQEPFSLEALEKNSAILFAERSIGSYLSPSRDVGAMLYSSIFQDSLHLFAGLFNGDGDDGSARGNEHDEPEVAARVVFSPFKLIESSHINITPIQSLQIGFSGTVVEADNLNIDLRVKSSGMAGTSRNIYELTHNTKFGVIQDVGQRVRTGIEAAWAYGPLSIQAEKIDFTYSDLDPAGSSPTSDADFSSWYVSGAWSLTGEYQSLSQGVLKPIYPNHFFNPSEKTWGAFVVAARIEHFKGDEDWINPVSNVSVREADGYSLAVNWILFPMCRVIADYSHTEFSDQIKARVLPDGAIDYIDEENCLTLRLSMDF